MADPTDAPHKGGRTRAGRIVLVLSLGLNLLVAGAVIGALLSGGPRARPDRDVRALGLGPFERALTRADLRAIRGHLRDDRDTLRAGARDLRGSVGEAAAALRADPFEPERLRAALERNRQAVAGLQAQAHGALAAHVAGLDRAGRLAFADRLEEALHHRRTPSED